jgi:hypothetical protein
MSYTEHQSRRALAALLRQASTYGSVGLIGILDVFPPEILDWHPKTWQLELKSTLGVLIEPDLFDKIQSARTIVTTDFAFRELPAFITCVNALSGDGVDTPTAAPIAPGDLAWGVLEMCLLWPPTAQDGFSEEIIAFIQETLRWQGIIGTPNSLINILPEAKYDETVMSDPDNAQLMFERLSEVNAEVTSNLRAWRWQMSQLRLAHGSTESLMEMFGENK